MGAAGGVGACQGKNDMAYFKVNMLHFAWQAKKKIENNA